MSFEPAASSSAVLPVRLKLDDDGVTTDLELMPLGYPGGSYFRNVYFTDKPAALARFISEGLAVFDDPQMPAELHALAVGGMWLSTEHRESGSDKFLLFSVSHHDGVVRFNTKKVSVETDFVPGYDNLTVLTAPGNDSINEYTSIHRAWRSDVAEVHDLIRYLGITYDGDGEVRTFPTPQTYMRRFEEWFAAHPHTRLYKPTIAPIYVAKFEGDVALEAYRAKTHLVSMTSLNYFWHDSSNDHLVALLTHGEPLMDLLSIYAGAVLDSESIEMNALEGRSLDAGTVSGKELTDRAGLVIDRLTAALGYLHVAKPPGRRYENIPPQIEEQETMWAIGEIVSTLKQTGRLDQTLVGQSIASKGIEVDAITADMLLDEIFDMTRQRLGISLDQPSPAAPTEVTF